MSVESLQMRKIPSCSRLGLALLLTAACSESGGPSASDEAIAAGRAACDRYLECVAATTPEAVGALLEGYGPEGTCWRTDEISAIELCTEACTAGRANAAKLFPDAGACGECSSDDDCMGAKTGPRCDTKTSSCVACLEAADCAGAVCETTKNTCVECVGDQDCGPEESCTTNKCGQQQACVPGSLRCTFEAGATLEICDDAGLSWDAQTDCSAEGLSCNGAACSYTAYGPCLASGDCPDEPDKCVAVGSEHGYCVNPLISCGSSLDCDLPTPNLGQYDINCVAQQCSLGCENNTPCPQGMTCVGSTCAWPR